jgi:hypothetical protein
MMVVEPALGSDVHQVALFMREADYAEFSAVSYARSRDELADSLAFRYGDRDDVLTGFWNGTPVCIGGFIAVRPNVITLLFFATDEFPKIGYGITRFIRKNLFPRLEANGVHRFEAISLSTHEHAHAWLRVLGLTPEGPPMLGYGRDGQSFIQFSKVCDVRAAGA